MGVVPPVMGFSMGMQMGVGCIRRASNRDISEIPLRFFVSCVHASGVGVRT